MHVSLNQVTPVKLLKLSPQRCSHPAPSSRIKRKVFWETSVHEMLHSQRPSTTHRKVIFHGNCLGWSMVIHNQLVFMSPRYFGFLDQKVNRKRPAMYGSQQVYIFSQYCLNSKWAKKLKWALVLFVGTCWHIMDHCGGSWLIMAHKFI